MRVTNLVKKKRLITLWHQRANTLASSIINMKYSVVALGLVAAVVAVPAANPEPTPAAELELQVRDGPVGGEVQGSVGSLSGFVSGIAGASTLAGCIGGVLPNGLGATLCFPPQFGVPTKATVAPTVAAPTVSTTKVSAPHYPYGPHPHPPTKSKAPKVSNAARQVGGQVGGSVSGLSGFVSGVVGSSTLAGCIGGKLPNGLGATLCFPPKFALPTKAPRAADAEAQIGGALGGFVGTGLFGTLSGDIGTALEGLIGGFKGTKGTTITAARPLPSKAPRDAEAQIGGALGGFVGTGLFGTLSGEVGTALEGLIGGFKGTKGTTITAVKPLPSKGPRDVTPVGGQVGGSVGKLSGFVTGTVDKNGVPFGCIGGVLPNGLGATLCAKNAAPTA